MRDGQVRFYHRSFCAECRRYSVHLNGNCIHHGEPGSCRTCGIRIETDSGYYRLGGKSFCIECGLKQVGMLDKVYKDIEEGL
jgi:hypothetical protein